MSNNGYVDTEEAAEMLGVGCRWVTSLGRQGRLTDTGQFRNRFKLWHRSEVEALRRKRRRPPPRECQFCGCIEDVIDGLCWICRLEERQPWHQRQPCASRPAVRRGKVAGQ